MPQKAFAMNSSVPNDGSSNHQDILSELLEIFESPPDPSPTQQLLLDRLTAIITADRTSCEAAVSVAIVYDRGLFVKETFEVWGSRVTWTANPHRIRHCGLFVAA
jgi:hypothetical protein